MQFKFDANQEFQIRAIESIADLLEGQPRIQAKIRFAPQSSMAAIANNLDLNENELLSNLQKVQVANGLQADTSLLPIEKIIETSEGRQPVRFLIFRWKWKPEPEKPMSIYGPSLSFFDVMGCESSLL